MGKSHATNIVYHEPLVSSEMRQQAAGHRGLVLWFTGLPSAGKSTVANVVDALLNQRGCRSFVLDGDNVRHGLNKNLGFSPEDRHENIRRIGEVAKLFADAGIIALTAFISPYREDRDRVRSLLPAGDFIEVFVDAPIKVCEQRDPKGLYRKARAGLLKEYTGVSAPYESPRRPEVILDSASKSPTTLGEEVMQYLEGTKVFLQSEQ